MRNEALPQSMTAEQLGVWLAENNIDKKFYSDETPYTEEEIIEFEHKSSLASRALDRLDEIEQGFKDILKDGCEDPVEHLIPPTKGRKILKANRIFADKQIEQGFNMQEIVLYGIPYSKEGVIMYFDVEGNVWDNYTLDMTLEQKEKYVGMFDEDSKNTIGNITGGAEEDQGDKLEGDSKDDEQTPDDKSTKTPEEESNDDPNAGKGDETPESEKEDEPGVDEDPIADIKEGDSNISVETVNLEEENQDLDEKETF